MSSSHLLSNSIFVSFHLRQTWIACNLINKFQSICLFRPPENWFSKVSRNTSIITRAIFSSISLKLKIRTNFNFISFFLESIIHIWVTLIWLLTKDLYKFVGIWKDIPQNVIKLLLNFYKSNAKMVY